jgi:hypothetical protein
LILPRLRRKERDSAVVLVGYNVRAQVVDDLLLLAIDPACQDEEQKLPRLQDEVQGSPEDPGEIRKSAVCRMGSGLSIGGKRLGQ